MAVMDANTVGETPEVVEGGQFPEDGGQVEESGLPSDGGGEEKSPWERAKEDGYLPEDYKEDPYELAKSWKNGQDFVTEAKKESGKIGQEKAAAEAEVNKARIVREELIPEFIESGKKLTPELTAKAKELGYSEADVELAYYKFNENANKAYAVVGSEAEYSQMMSEMAPKMSDSQRASFDAAFDQGISEYAIKGLMAEWKGGEVAPSGKRIEGKVGNSGGVKPYANQGEMLNDLAYLKSRGKNDLAARKKYEARKAVTSDKVLFARGA